MNVEIDGIILSCIGGRYAVLANNRRYSCYAKGSFRHRGIRPLPGDLVRFVPGASFEDDETPLPPSGENDGYLVEIAERKTLLNRPAVANIDTLLIVCAAADPKPDLLYLDRLTVSALHAGIHPVILCNKQDLDINKASALVKLYRAAGFDAYALAAEKQQGLDFSLLSDLLKGHITALAGFSGVGKTTFFNLLFPAAQGEVGALSQKIGRGKNTTRTTVLHSLQHSILKIPGLFADTAGFSRLDLNCQDSLTSAELPLFFPEFSKLIGTCKFTKCTHKSEPGCALRAAVQAGLAAESRYESLLKLKQELETK